MAFFLFLCNLLIPACMLLGGWWLLRRPPKEINALLGYRTTMSRKNQDTWQFAHDYCGRLWLKLSIPFLLVSAAVQLPFLHADEDTFGLLTLLLEGIQIAFLLSTIYFVEKALKRNFDENGNRTANCE